tara:strand:+ start:66 stop:971 length:906 start_codon:yes stop_codon:yes gene_type:complete
MAHFFQGEIDPASEKMLKECFKALHMLGDKPLKEVMRDQGRLLAVDLSKWTHVIGSKAVIGKMQKAAIERSIKRTYKSANMVAGAIMKMGGKRPYYRFMGYINTNNVAAAQTMVDEMDIRVGASPWGNRPIKIMRFDDGALHYRRRFGKDMAIPRVNYVVTNYRKVALPSGKGNTFVNREKKKAGQLKAGWAEAARQLGGVADPTKGIPAYAKAKHHKVKGIGKLGGSINKKTVTVANLSDYAEYGTVEYDKALKLRATNLKKVLERMLKRSARAVTKAQRSRNRDLGIAAKTVKNALKMI